MDRKGSAELLSCDASRSKHASCDSLASDSKSSSLNSKLGQESVSILAVNCLYCHKIKQQTLDSQNTTILYYIYVANDGNT